MNMTNEEIVRDYKQAAKPEEQIAILADLNECTKKEIAQILIDAGMDVPGWYTKGKKKKPAEAAGDEPRTYAEATGKALDVAAVRGAALEVIRELIEQDTDADVIYDRIIGVIVLEKKLEAQHGHV